MTNVMTTQKAIRIMIKFETSPLYIVGSRAKYNEAKEFIESLFPSIQKECYAKITKAIDKYHEPIKGMNGNSAYDMDQLMLK